MRTYPKDYSYIATSVFRAGLNLAVLPLRGELSTGRATEGRLRRTRLALFNLVPDSVHKRPQLSRARGMPQFAQRLGFDLSDAFAGNCERLPDFFQSVLAAVFETETHFDDFFFARGE